MKLQCKRPRTKVRGPELLVKIYTFHYIMPGMPPPIGIPPIGAAPSLAGLSATTDSVESLYPIAS